MADVRGTDVGVAPNSGPEGAAAVAEVVVAGRVSVRVVVGAPGVGRVTGGVVAVVIDVAGAPRSATFPHAAATISTAAVATTRALLALVRTVCFFPWHVPVRRRAVYDSATIRRSLERAGRVHEAEVAEGLRNIFEQIAGAGIDLLGQEPRTAGAAHEPVHEL
jgi:hypothetical protein